MLMSTKNSSLLIGSILLIFSSCQSGQETKESKDVNDEQSKFHKVVVEEVMQASQYTYLHAKENSNEVWLAVPSMQAKTGETYYYEGGIETKNFESKELHKVFDNIILLEKLNTEPKSSAIAASDNHYTPADNSAATNSMQDTSGAGGQNYTRKATPIEKKEVKIAAAKGGITIAELYANKASYAGKTVKIKGQVTKYTPAVMNKNWIHIQDGSDHNGKFDLAVTSDGEVKVGDVVTFEGKVSLDKDLGYGYFFDVIMEDATIK